MGELANDPIEVLISAYSLVGEIPCFPGQVKRYRLEGTELTEVAEFALEGTCLEVRLGRDDADLVAVATDGIGTFYDKASRKAVDLPDVLRELFNFRSAGPTFVTRRLSAFSRATLRRGWEHFDDISLAGVMRRGERP